jgi:flagellar biosynthetic protein FliP
VIRAALSLAILLALLLLPGAAHAQSFAFDLGHPGDTGATAHLVQITALFTILSLAPSLLVMVTAFTRIVVVLSLLRGALGAQGTPPNMVLIGLSMFLTFFVMEPAFDQAWTQAILPLQQGRIGELDALQKAAEPFRAFMAANARPTDLALFQDIGHLPPVADLTHPPWRALIPAFMVGELRRAFEMGFLLYLPFTIIDLVVASVLMSLGMMMLPPNGVSLPFKLIFFVMVDGWRMVAGSLTQSFAPG